MNVMRQDYVNSLKSQKESNLISRRGSSIVKIIGSFIVGVTCSIVLTTAYASYSSDKSYDLVPNMVASVALHQHISVLGLWDDVQSYVGRPYSEFSAHDNVRAMQYIATKMTLPPQRKAVPGEYLLFNHKQ